MQECTPPQGILEGGDYTLTNSLRLPHKTAHTTSMLQRFYQSLIYMTWRTEGEVQNTCGKLLTRESTRGLYVGLALCRKTHLQMRFMLLWKILNPGGECVYNRMAVRRLTCGKRPLQSKLQHTSGALSRLEYNNNII